MSYLKSREVIDVLGIPYSRLVSLLRSRKLPSPEKDCSGDLTWSPRDVENARKALKTLDARRKRQGNAAVAL